MEYWLSSEFFMMKFLTCVFNLLIFLYDHYSSTKNLWLSRKRKKKNWFLYRIMIRNEVSLIGDEMKLKIILLFSDFIHLSFWNQGDAVIERDKLIFYTVLFQYSSNYLNDQKLTFKRSFLKYLVRKQLRKLQWIGILMSYFYN